MTMLKRASSRLLAELLLPMTFARMAVNGLKIVGGELVNGLKIVGGEEKAD